MDRGVARVHAGHESCEDVESVEVEMMAKYKVPEAMIHAAMAPTGWHLDRYPAHTGGFCEGVSVRDILEAALAWLAENPIVPTHKQWTDMVTESWLKTEDKGPDAHYLVVEWQRHMFKSPETEVPEEIKDLLLPDIESGFFKPEVLNQRLEEAFKRGLAARKP